MDLANLYCIYNKYINGSLEIAIQWPNDNAETSKPMAK